MRPSINALLSLLAVAATACGSQAPVDPDAGVDVGKADDAAEDAGADRDAALDAIAPVGRQYWSASYGYFVPNGTPWVRNVNYTFTPISGGDGGTVDASLTQWGSTTGPARATAGTTGACNGTASGCAILEAVPTLTTSWSGTFEYTGDLESGTLAITWSNGNSETWTVSEVRDGTLGKMTLDGADFPGSDPNRGVGYGSTQPFSYYKTAGAVDSAEGVYLGRYDRNVGGTVALDQAWNLNLGGFEGEATGAKSLHLLQSPTLVPPSGCTFAGVAGNIYHLWVSNADRLLVQNNYKRCLVSANGNGCYSGGMHIAMLMQVIDDNKNLVGVVGSEAATSGGFTYARIDALLP